VTESEVSTGALRRRPIRPVVLRDGASVTLRDIRPEDESALTALYERLSTQAAEKIVASLRGVEPVRPRRAVHQPVYHDDEATRGRRGSALRRPAAAETKAPARESAKDRQRTM